MSSDMIDPTDLDDPVAMQTDWTPAKSGGTSFGTHKVVEPNSDRLEFQVGTGAKLFYLIFLVIGVVVLIVAFCKISFGGAPVNRDTLGFMGFGLVFTIAGACMLYFGTAPIVFDKRLGFFWKGRKNPDHVFDKRTLKHFAELEKIHALQLISEYVRSQKNSYHSFELNLVLEDGKRINVVDHGNRIRLREDAETLAAFLDKTIWDAI